MMRTILTILAIFFVRYAHSRAAPEPFFHKEGDCSYGVKTISLLVYNSNNKGQNMSITDMCNNVEPSQKVAFLVHGFVSTVQAGHFRSLALQLAEKGYTVFAVDWSQGACTTGLPVFKFMDYNDAVKNTRAVGQRVASYVKKLIKECGVSLEQITFIGHSLGAHVCGFAAKKIRNKKLGTVSLIIAADPANPSLGCKNCDDRLCHTDCSCLKVVHTSTLGMGKALGHLDLQFNNGNMQPGCWADLSQACSHGLSVKYIENAAGNTCVFPGVPIKEKLGVFDSTPPYPADNETNCIIVNENLLDPSCSIKGQYYVFVDSKTYCTENPPLNCQKQ